MAIDNKYHIKIDSKGFILDRGRNAVFAYQKKRAPNFVNKFGSGDSSYRDATFWQFWAQINWRNGSKQEKWGDGGRFWKSQNVDVTAEEKLQLAKNFVSAGQVEAGAKINAMAAWRSSQSWWNANYTYRKQLTITAPSAQALPVGYPIVITEDTAALESGGKVRSDRKDWRVVYFNGTSYVDLTRDYVTTGKTVFALQAAISAAGSDNNYYVFYGYSSESTDKQPTTDADWNAVYGLYGTTPDANSLGVWHVKEGSGTSLVDTAGAYDLACSTTTPSWNTTGPFGRSVKYSGTTPQEPTAFGVTISGGDPMDVGSFTFEFFAKNSSWGGVLGQYGSDGDSSVKFKIYYSSGGIAFQKNTGASTSETQISTSILLNDSLWHHYAVTFDGTQTAKFYRDGTLIDTKTFSASGIRTVGGRLHFFRDQLNATFSHIRMSNTSRSSFPYAWDTNTYPVVVSIDSEQTTQPPSSNFILYAGTNTGKVYQWDGSTGWTLAFDAGLLENYETGNDTDNRIGDTAGTEYKRAQAFKIDKDMNIKSILAYLKATATTPSGDITVRIETNNAGVPSGTLADSHATGTISNFSDTSYGWRTCTFATAFKLTAATTYWLVLSVGAQANDVGFDIAGDNSSPSYTDGNAAVHNGSWSAEAGKDLYFRIRSTDTSVNCFLVSSIGGTQKLFIGLGAISSQTAADARIATFDGSAWAFHYTFSTDCQVMSLAEFSDKLYAGVGPKAIIYESSNATAWTQSKDIQFPQNPGYIYSLKEYNSSLIAIGGSPEYLYDKNYDGFAYIFNGTVWQSLYPFDHTVVRCMEFYDAFLFMGTYHGQIYTYNTSFLDPLFSFRDDYKYNVVVNCMKYFDDKLFIGLYPQTGITEANVGLWVFDRHGMSLTAFIGGIAGITSLEQVNNTLMIGTGDDGYVYKIDAENYNSSGYLQTSYFDANLPSINKLWNKIELNFNPLRSGESITLSYKYKEEATSWTSLAPDTPLAVGDTSATFSFEPGSVSRKISVKIDITVSNTSQTPVITEYILRYSLFPVTKYQWSLRIKAKSPLLLADKTVDPRSGETLRSDLEALLSDTQLHTFTDIDGSTHTVLFNDLDETSWVINEEDTSGASVPITLIEA